MSPRAKVLIPNMLTLSRLILTPIIAILGLTRNYKIALVLVVIACITDLFDGKLARHFNTVTDIGAKLDSFCDKIFAIGLTACLINKYSLFIYLLILEVIIGICNLFFYYKTNNCESLMIGKIKTTFLFVTVSIGFATLFIGFFNKVIPGFILTTLNIQILTFISYIFNFYDNVKNKSIEETIANDKTDKRIKIYDIDQNNQIKDNEYSSDTKVLNDIKDIFLEED